MPLSTRKPTGDEPDGDAADMAASPDAPAQNTSAPEPSPAATDDASSPDADLEQPAADLVRLVPADWTVDGLQFPYGDPDAEDGGQPMLHVTREQGYTVPAAQADDIIAAAGTHGFALTKEPVA